MHACRHHQQQSGQDGEMECGMALCVRGGHQPTVRALETKTTFLNHVSLSSLLNLLPGKLHRRPVK
eukprot:350384-Chlamydomonas_euryale.AAC.10